MKIPTWLSVILVGIAVIISLFVIGKAMVENVNDLSGTFDDSYSDTTQWGDESVAYSDQSCNVAGIMLHGALATYNYYEAQSEYETDIVSADNVISYLQAAEDAENIEVVLFEIDSYGGSPVAAEEIVSALEKYVTKPVIVQIREAGVSAGYWIAAAGDVVFASSLSDVGGIGVTMSYIDEHILNQNEGYTYNEINSGKFKDSGNPQKELTAEERELFERDVAIIYEAFVASVAKNRKLDTEAVRQLADGSTMLGQMAKENGLIDEIGGYYEILDFIKEQYVSEPVVCWQ